MRTVPRTIWRVSKGLPYSVGVVVQILAQRGSFERDAGEEALRPRPRQDVGVHLRVGLRRRRASNRPGRRRGFAAERELVGEQLSAPRSFMTSMIRSVDEPPIWKPTLPPSIRTAAGADQPAPVLLRHDR